MVNYELGNYEAAADWSEKAMREAPTYVLPYSDSAGGIRHAEAE